MELPMKQSPTYILPDGLRVGYPAAVLMYCFQKAFDALVASTRALAFRSDAPLFETTTLSRS